MDYLDVTFDLPSGKFWPYRKPNNEPLYIHAKSNHPPTVLKHIPKNINDRLSFISCDRTEFNKSKPMYEEALKRSGFEGKLEYNPNPRPAVSAKKKRRRRRNIIWFNPPYDINCSTDVGRIFLSLIDKHFPEHHRYHSLFNRNTVKMSYCCMGNVGSIISSHNAKLLQPEKPPVSQSGCNCRNKSDCPMEGNCQAECIVYKAEISAPTKPEKIYYGLTEGEFKTRHRNHKTSFSHSSKRNATELSKYYWKLRDEGVNATDIKVKWSIEQKASKYKCGTRRCDLCLTESLIIALADKSNLLNKRSELVGTCRHMMKYRYSKIKQ